MFDKLQVLKSGMDVRTNRQLVRRLRATIAAETL